MSKIIIFDFEVFKYDCLLGTKILEGDSVKIYQTWDLEEIKKFYKECENDIWIGHNSIDYDSLILEAIYKNKNPYLKSKEIINGGFRNKSSIPKFQYDLISQHFGSLKAIEAAFGKNISETEVDFDLDRPLTEKEKRMTESYNQDDLNQTHEDLMAVWDEFSLRIEMIKEFNQSLNCLSITGTQLAEKVLEAKKIEGIENWVIKPIIYPQLQVKNQEVLNYYLNEDFKIEKKKKLEVELCGVTHKMGSGGIHAAKKKYHADWAYYFDVSGYYNLVMINYDLLPRSISEKGKELYKFMYQEQLRLKKTNPRKRKVYKPILLAVFGAMNYKGSNFYDPYKGSLVTIVGQLFLVDLLEKLEGKIDLIQSNTDGVIAKPLPGVSDQELLNIIDEWQNRTGFTLKLDKIYDIQQRDVNNYMYRTEEGKIKCLGEAIKYYNNWDNVLAEDCFNSKEPIILQQCIVDYYIKHKLPEETVEENKKTLRLFQYIVKKLSYDWMEYEVNYYNSEESNKIKLQHVNRAFAWNSEECSGKIIKYKIEENGNLKKGKPSSLPESVFVHNDEILSEESVEKIIKDIDYQYYVDRAYERILEFTELPVIKGINI